MSDVTPQHASDSPDQSAEVDRRTAVRRVATVLGLSAGAVAIPGLSGTAHAKPGDPVIAGGTTKAGDGQTALQSSGPMPTLRVENSRSRSGPVADQVDLIAPQLQLTGPVPSGTRPQVPDLRNLPEGAVGGCGGLLFVAANVGGDDIVPVQVHTSLFGNFFHPIPAARSQVLDTAALPQEARDGYSDGTFDDAGRLIAGARLPIDLRPLVDTTRALGSAAAAVTITVTGAAAEGAVSAHDAAEGDGAATVASYGVVPAPPGGTPYPIPTTASAVLGLDADDRLWLSVSAAAHLRIDVTGVILPEPAALVEPAEIPADAAGWARRRALQRQAVRELMESITLPE